MIVQSPCRDYIDGKLLTLERFKERIDLGGKLLLVAGLADRRVGCLCALQVGPRLALDGVKEFTDQSRRDLGDLIFRVVGRIPVFSDYLGRRRRRRAGR